MAEFEAHEHFSKRTFKCKLFLFQQGLMYTKVISKQKLGYCGYFKFDSFFDCQSFLVKEIRVCNKLNNHFITFSSDNVLLMVEMRSIILELIAQNKYNLLACNLNGNHEEKFNETSSKKMQFKDENLVEVDQNWVRKECLNFNENDMDQQ